MKTCEYTSEPGKWRQFLTTIAADIMPLSIGIMVSWASPVTTQLISEDTPVGDRPMTHDDISWMNSAVALGPLASLPFCNSFNEKFGRKISVCLIAIPLITCWLLTLFATSYGYLLVGRFCGGLAMGMATNMVPLYVSEIAAISIRGQLGSYMMFSVKIGIVLGYILGAVLTYRWFAICGLMGPLVFLLAFVFMPETPIYLVRKGQIDRATRSLMWLKGNNKTAVASELLHLQSLVKESSNGNRSVGFRDLFRDRGTIRGLLISLTVLCGQQTCGIFILLAYTTYILKMAESSMTPEHATIIIGAMQVVGSCMATQLMERAGRKSLMLISCAGMATCYAIISTFLYLKEWDFELSSFGWLPVTALSIYAVVYSVGMGPAPFVVTTEVFSPEISSFANSATLVCSFTCSFVMVKSFSPLIALCGLHGCFLILGAFCMTTFVLICFLVPETKGRKIESILDELNGCPRRFDQNAKSEAAVEMITMDKKAAV